MTCHQVTNGLQSRKPPTKLSVEESCSQAAQARGINYRVFRYCFAYYERFADLYEINIVVKT